MDTQAEVQGELAARTAARVDTALEQFHALIDGGTAAWWDVYVDLPGVKSLVDDSREIQAIAVGIVLDKMAAFDAKQRTRASMSSGIEFWWQLTRLLRSFLERHLPLPESAVSRLVNWAVGRPQYAYAWGDLPLGGIVSAVEHCFKTSTPGSELCGACQTWIKQLQSAQGKDARKLAERLELLVVGEVQVVLQTGEAWSDAALADLGAMPPQLDRQWRALLLHCQQGGSGKLSARWQKGAQQLISAVGKENFKDHVSRWFPLIDKPRTTPFQRGGTVLEFYNDLIIEPHVALLRGLCWCAGLEEDADLARALMRLALSSYRKIPEKGPRLVSLGNACVTALGSMPGRTPIGQLAVLKVKIKFGTAQKEVEKAFQAAAEREGLPRDEIEELAVPEYGLTEVGLLREPLGEFEAVIRIEGSSAELAWSKGGKPLKSVPTAVKSDFAEELKELKSSLKDINTMLPAQRERLDSMFLSQRSWPLGMWRERYLDHPLVGTITRRLIWTFAHDEKAVDTFWHDGRLVDVTGREVAVDDNTTVALWHPIGHSIDEITAWRRFIEEREIVQPFKQAHREVYLLTDAERRTNTYSNRFAAHVLRQHQFNALCLARGWKNRLRLMVDDTYPPAHRPLPAWNLRAEFWIEGAGDEYGRDTNDSGTYLYLTTDQVRFYNLAAPQLHAQAGTGAYTRWNQATEDPLPIEQIPPLVLSEILRDVDLFVGVASVGNDPNWSDGGPDGRYRDYWHQTSFGDLSATAETRRALLAGLVPRLKIAGACTLDEKFLIVRGSLRTYKIHLGSGNILMEPNDQYLCIVPKQSTAGRDRVFLPFEGDNTISIILSKAFLLADDRKITDPTITSQINRK